MYDMLVQWVKTGKGWVTSFEEDFQYHKARRKIGKLIASKSYLALDGDT